jgi:hypothetical protein
MGGCFTMRESLQHLLGLSRRHSEFVEESSREAFGRECGHTETGTGD